MYTWKSDLEKGNAGSYVQLEWRKMGITVQTRVERRQWSVTRTAPLGVTRHE